MHLHVPNSAFLHNIENFINRIEGERNGELRITFHPKWVSIHPVILSMLACRAQQEILKGNKVIIEYEKMRSLPYLIRMKLFDYLEEEMEINIMEHESSGRFIPITNVRCSEDLGGFITDMIPLLHSSQEKVEPIQYVISELVRNVLEHSESIDGAYVSAQLYPKGNRISIGVADSGKGIRKSMELFHLVEDDLSAIKKALIPGITGTTHRFGGSEENAGAGLFFIKSIATLNRDHFFIYSGNSYFKLRKVPLGKDIILRSDSNEDYSTTSQEAGFWQGTAVGIDISLDRLSDFQQLLSEIRKAYSFRQKQEEKKRYKRLVFK